MQVFMGRGIFKNWKQPIYVNFDQLITPEILSEAISILYENSYNMVACVSDCGGGNVGLWKKLDTGFILSDGCMINATPLKELLKVTNTEISVCHRLSQKHLECVKAERQNVGLAAQLLSHSVATALIYYKPGKNTLQTFQKGVLISIKSTQLCMA
ncbi:hypothetical protein QTP88_013507 [Uroleucon formosanum]